MKRPNEPMTAYPVSSEVISVSRYLKLSEAEKSSIRSTEIAPPKLGRNDFGRIIVHYKTPIYKVG
ncbi:hypothetical protein TEP_15070 [Stenotrophomonas sp. TEPEL]|uniref:hypothetical protein n=1 Tax=Stenotrophomonas sp. TEPEL TaxID=2283801 RepID=UPI001048CCD0|nr:hypothetical protein [Stenotrophomonas sp. TEPEL]TDB34849.1 hypothetical protein TEP_15070 [Stenotrophomonas sp. TEPEL]